jgi:hypothetical protein
MEAADSAQALCQFCREQQSSSEPLRWIARANPPALFFHEFLDSHDFPNHGIHRSSHNRLESGGRMVPVTKDSWQAACFGESKRAKFNVRQACVGCAMAKGVPYERLCTRHPCHHRRASRRCCSARWFCRSWIAQDSGCNVRDATRQSQRGRSDGRENGKCSDSGYPKPSPTPHLGRVQSVAGASG